MSRTATLNLAHTAILKTRELNYLCCALSYIHFICIIGLVVSVFMMGLERSIAVRHVHSYYEEERPLSIVFLLITAAIAGGGAFCYFCAARYIVYDADPATQTFLAAEKNIPATVFAFSFGFVGCVGGALAQLRQNSNAANRFRSFKGTVSLNVRLLSEEILISSAILRRIAVAYVVTCLDGILLSLARWEIFGGIGTDSTLNKLLTELSFFNVDICVVFVMVFFMLKHQYVRTIVRGDLLKFVSVNVADRLVPPGPTFVIPQTSAYFQQMNSAWDVRKDELISALVLYKVAGVALATCTVQKGNFSFLIVHIAKKWRYGFSSQQFESTLHWGASICHCRHGEVLEKA
ncbi:unnamed protein product [Bursaphelenchus xylophilus]|uniref:(pine wood nematode) hypothetical protein n=1 Tax=Bursaphelenchus xylophilus TaxID=6326 RepID=A0A811LFD1_BURXY|nr:unnamed protein product [Bursaphelenchus xylophilus]CAG9118689.1 unnamed protein product [Bursaphelenchus xylophilus]